MFKFKTTQRSVTKVCMKRKLFVKMFSRMRRR